MKNITSMARENEEARKLRQDKREQEIKMMACSTGAKRLLLAVKATELPEERSYGLYKNGGVFRQ